MSLAKLTSADPIFFFIEVKEKVNEYFWGGKTAIP